MKAVVVRWLNRSLWLWSVQRFSEGTIYRLWVGRLFVRVARRA
jgi:hypothetical protein